MHRTALGALSKADQRRVTELSRAHPRFRWNVARVGPSSVMIGRTESFSRTHHPALLESITKTPHGESRRTYGKNPPIYHRIEEMLLSSHPRYSLAEANTLKEERKGLLSRSDIGTRDGWNRIRGSTNTQSDKTFRTNLGYSRARFSMTDEQILKLVAGIGIGGGIAYLLWPKESSAAPGVPQALSDPNAPEIPVAPVVGRPQPGQPAPIPPPVIRDQLSRTLIQAGVNPQLVAPTSIAGLSVIHVGTMRPRPSQGQVRRMQRKGLIPPMGSSGVARRGKGGRQVRKKVTQAIQAVIEHHRVNRLSVPGTPVYIVRKALKDLGPNTPRRWKRRFGWEEQWFVGFIPQGGFHSFRVNAIESRNRSLADIRPVGGIDYGPVQTREIALTEKVLKALMEAGAPWALKVLEKEQSVVLSPQAPPPQMPPPPSTQEMEEREVVADERAAEEAADDDISLSDDDIEDAERVIESQEEAASQQNPNAPRVVQGRGGWTYRQHPNGTIDIIGAPSGHQSGARLTSGSSWNAITNEIGTHPAAPQAPSGAPRIVLGSGGYKYEQHPNGAVRILVDPSGKAAGVTLTSGRAWRAITQEIGEYSNPGGSGTSTSGPPRPSRELEPGAPRDVSGAGGWTYRQFSDGRIQIVGAPAGHQPGAVLTAEAHPAAWRAISSEIGPYPTGSNNHGRHHRRRRAG